MADITDQNVGPTNLGELAVAGVAKFAGERALKPVVGDGNMISGATKVALGVGIDSVSGNSTLAKGTALGVGIDGIEDLLFTVSNQTGVASSVMGGSGSISEAVM